MYGIRSQDEEDRQRLHRQAEDEQLWKYGEYNKEVYVSESVRPSFKAGDFVRFTGETWGGDPAPGTEKMEVIYVDGDEAAVKSPSDGLIVVRFDEIEMYTDPAVSGNNTQGVSMANNVTGQVVGGASRVFTGVSTVGEIATALGATDRVASVNGAPVDHSQVLKDYDFVSFSDKKKGGL